MLPSDSPPAVVTTPVGRVVSPADEDAVAAALAEAHGAGKAVVLRGGGTRLGLGRPPERADLLLDLRGLAGIVEHHVRDLTVECRAGTTVAALNEALALHGQFLPLDPPFPERATLGGVIAAGEPGYRSVPGCRPRDLLLGMRAVLADGTRIRSGGRVVKNVTGYELTRLFSGSLGTLGAITRVTLRLRALPEASRTVLAALPVGDSARQFAGRILAASAEAQSPAAVAVVPPGTGLPGLPEDGGFRLAVRFEGLVEEAAAPVEGIERAAGGPAAALEGAAERALWAGVRDFLPGTPERTASLGLAARGPKNALLRTAWRLAAFGPPIAFPDQGRALASIPPDRFDAALSVAESGVAVAVETAPPGWKKEHPVFHPPPPKLNRALSARIRSALDPRGILAPGRMP